MTVAPHGVEARTAVLIRRTITIVVFIIAGLAFSFGFGNSWQLGLSLGVSGWIAPLVAPAVDLSVLTLLASIQYLRAIGVGGRLVGPRLLLGVCGCITFALNTLRPILSGAHGRAAYDAVAPLLLIGWGEIGPRLLALLYSSRPDPERTVPDDSGPAAQLVLAAAEADRVHREAVGRSITRDELRAQLKVSNATAGELLRLLRAAQDGEGAA
jgi:hypothetical protein